MTPSTCPGVRRGMSPGVPRGMSTLPARLCALALAASLGGALLPASAQSPGDAVRAKGGTGLALPRFASLKVDRVNLRQGPGTEYPTAWVYQRAGWPVEILREFEGWRQVRDSDDTVGWVQGAMLSGRRTVLVRGGAQNAPDASNAIPLRADASERSSPVAYVEPGIVGGVLACDGRWCRMSVGEVRGWIEQSRLWGVYPGEAFR